MKVKNWRLMWNDGHVITPSLVWLRMKYRWERLRRDWHLHYQSLYKEEMCWRVYTTEGNHDWYYNIFAKTKADAVKWIAKYIWHGPGFGMK